MFFIMFAIYQLKVEAQGNCGEDRIDTAKTRKFRLENATLSYNTRGRTPLIALRMFILSVSED